jgi:3-oxoacyl-[acyl-carrier protein] reductase
MKNLILTGCTRGLGLEILKSLTKKKYNLILISKNKKKLLKLKKIYKKKKVKVFIYSVDLSNLEKLRKTLNKIKFKFKKIDIIINNAGIWGPIGKFEYCSWKKWISAININLFASIYLVKYFLPSMKKNNFGRIVQLSGGGATKPMPYFSAYAVSKTGIVRFVETISKECDKYNITINAVAPGAMNTGMLSTALKSGKKILGPHYKKLVKQKKEGGAGFDKAIALIHFLIDSNKFSGKLISAIWDRWNSKAFFYKASRQKNYFTLRRKI